MSWNPDQYEKFHDERTAPVLDLLSLLRIRPKIKAIDLGCGTGEHTRRLADMLPECRVKGIDTSPEMLAKSKQYERPGLTFELRSFEDIDGDYDVIFSNAALQWSGHHEELFPEIWRHLAPGGQLLVQMPSNQDHYSHLLAYRLATEDFADYFPVTELNPVNRLGWMLPVERYAELMFDLGGQEITALMKVYPHILENADAIVEWTKGTLLVPYMAQLSPEIGAEFMTKFREALRAKFPQQPVFYGFKRIILSAVKVN